MHPPNVECLDAETLAAYLDGLLGEEAVGRAERHIDHCRACRTELSALAATRSFPTGSGAFEILDGLSIGGRLGRYEVSRELGRGSMGVVMRAYDPELARAVALKILDSRAAGARARLRHEAQAMARLTHPNVVTIYDVVTHGDTICIAMELVEGETLRDHASKPRSWRATLDICMRAGRGLAAAHAARLIHRDYKPENVLCAADGRVVVSDFGLAQLDDDDPPSAATLAGTPAYMAPELLRGERATAASDQFSFCVTTYEALYGVRPFAGDTLVELRERIVAGIPREPPSGTCVPSSIRAVLLRGLATDPARRFASMSDLLDALGVDRTRRRRRTAIVIAVAVAASVLVLRELFGGN
jgi:serine/threonine protein kinase